MEKGRRQSESLGYSEGEACRFGDRQAERSASPMGANSTQRFVAKAGKHRRKICRLCGEARSAG